MKQGMKATECILTSPSLRAATILITMMKRHSPLLNDPDPTVEKLNKFWATISMEDAETAMFVASSVYSAYQLGLKHGAAGTPLDTSTFADVVAEGERRCHENPTPDVP